MSPGRPAPGTGRRVELGSLAERLKRCSRKLTGPRQAILEVLRQQGAQPLSAREILQLLGSRVCDLATIYRSMHMLEKEGMVKRFDFGDGGRFRLLEEGDDGHHHHLVCVECAAVVEIEECFPDEVERRIAARNGFKAVTHRLEFFGVCPKCQ